MFKVDLKFHEAFIKPIPGLYDEHIFTVDGFKENNIELMKGCWIDTRHGKEGGKIYELFDENMNGELIKEGMQEWMCNNRLEITSCISIALNNHEHLYAEWFKYVDDCSGPDKLSLYCLSQKYGMHTSVYNKSYVWTTLSNHLMLSDTEIFKRSGVRLIFLGQTHYGILWEIKQPSPGRSMPPSHQPLTTNPHQLKRNVVKLCVEKAPEPVLKNQRVHQQQGKRHVPSVKIVVNCTGYQILLNPQ